MILINYQIFGGANTLMQLGLKPKRKPKKELKLKKNSLKKLPHSLIFQ